MTIDNAEYDCDPSLHDLGPEIFTCPADAVFALYQELMEVDEPSRVEIQRALHYLALNFGMTRVGFEIEDLGPEGVL